MPSDEKKEPIEDLKDKGNEGHPIFFLSREKARKNKIFKNNELKIDPLFGNTPPSDSVHGFVFDFDEFLANNEL